MALEGWIQTQFCPTAGTGRCGGSRVAAEETSEEAAPLALEDLPRTPKAPKVKAAKAARAPRQQPSKGIIARAGRVRLYQAGGTVFWGKMRDSWWGLMLGNGQPSSPGHCGGQQH